MIKAYEDKLLQLAQEILDIRDDKNGYHLRKFEVIQEKVNYLLGYIMALKEVEKDDIKTSTHCR